MLPVVGITLPLVSYGGSGLVAHCLALGLAIKALVIFYLGTIVVSFLTGLTGTGKRRNSTKGQGPPAPPQAWVPPAGRAGDCRKARAAD